MESERNNKILEQAAAGIGVEIEPEPTYLISKDTNNRIELDMATGKIQSASGGTLACQSWAGKKGPSPTKNLAHPAIIDWALAEYLIFASTDKTGRASIDGPFNPVVGRNILKSAFDKMSPVRALNMYQNVVASSPASVSYVFYTKDDDPAVAIPMQHYNRVFIMKNGTPDTVHLHVAASRKLTPVQIRKRQSTPDTRIQQHDPVAVDILSVNGVKLSEIPQYNEAIVKKVTNIDDAWCMRIENRDLDYIPREEIDEIIADLDLGKYLILLGDCFESNWRNHLPGGLPATDLAPYGKYGIDWDPDAPAAGQASQDKFNSKPDAAPDPDPPAGQEPAAPGPDPEPAQENDVPPWEDDPEAPVRLVGSGNIEPAAPEEIESENAAMPEPDEEPDQVAIPGFEWAEPQEPKEPEKPEEFDDSETQEPAGDCIPVLPGQLEIKDLMDLVQAAGLRGVPCTCNNPDIESESETRQNAICPATIESILDDLKSVIEHIDMLAMAPGLEPDEVRILQEIRVAVLPLRKFLK